MTDESGAQLGSDPTLDAGQTVTVEASGFAAGEEVTVTVNSTPMLLGSVTADADGSVTYVFTVPTSLEAGAHTLVLAGSSTSVTVPFQVAAAGDDSGELPSTGGNVGTLGLFALGALVAGAGALVISRRIS